MGALSGEAVLGISFFLPSLLGSTHKGKNLLHLEQIVSFKSRHLFGSVLKTRQTYRKLQNLSPFLAHLYKSTGRAFVVTLISASMSIWCQHLDVFVEKS